MLRRLVLSLGLLSILAFPSTAFSAEVRIIWPMSGQLILKNPNQFVALLTAYTEEEFFELSRDVPDSLRQPVLETCRRIKCQNVESLNRDVSIVILQVKTGMRSHQPCILSTTDDFGLIRGDQVIPAYGLFADLAVPPSGTGIAYIVFPPVEIVNTDEFYIILRPTKP